jgi:hypothetical protein
LTIKRFSSCLCIAVVALAVGGVSAAEAVPFTLNSYTVNINTSNPGLVLWESDIFAEPSTFQLSAPGDSFTTSLFRLGTNEPAVNPDDFRPRDVSVGFSFTSPLPGFNGNAAGLTGAAWLGQGFGYVLWDNPLQLAFGTSGLLSIFLSNAAFGVPGYADITATFQLTRADAIAPVPEPATVTLLGSGVLFVIVGGRARARRRLAATRAC